MSKILVFGDSIAYGKWDSEGGWVTLLRKYVDQTYNSPIPTNFQVYNCSIPGEVAIRLVERFEKELLARIPLKESTNNKNLVIFAIGTNDSCPNNWMTLRQTPEDEFKNVFKKLIEVSLQYNAHVVCIGLTPVDPNKSKGLLFTNEEVKKYDLYISEVCQAKGIDKLDLFEELKKNNFANLLVDSVHPNTSGHKILFENIVQFLKARKLFEYFT